MDVAIDLIQTCACEISQRQKCIDLQKSSGTLDVRLNLTLERGMISMNQFISDHISNKYPYTSPIHDSKYTKYLQSKGGK